MEYAEYEIMFEAEDIRWVVSRAAWSDGYVAEPGPGDAEPRGYPGCGLRGRGLLP